MERSRTSTPAKPKPLWRRRPWRTAVRLLVLLVLLATLAVVAAPFLLPSSIVRDEVAKVLAARLGRPVSVESARFSWHRGLLAKGIRVQAGNGAEPGALFAKADRLAVRFHPLDAPAAAIGSDVPIESVRLEGLEVWLAVDQAGQWNAPAAGSAQHLQVGTIQVTGGTFHVENRRLGRSVDLTNLSATLGQLATTGRGYVNLTAELPGEPQGRLVATASLSSLDFSQPERLTGSLKAEWDGVDWPETLAAVFAESYLVNSVGLTSGRLSATFGRGQWNVEGAIEASDLALGDPRAAPDGSKPQSPVTFDRAVLGFQMRRPDSRKPIELNLVRFSARGVNLQLSGTVRPDGQEGPEAALRMIGTLDWAPLAESVKPLQDLAERFEELGGGAELNLRDIQYAAGALKVVGAVDLAATKAHWPGVIHKEAGRPLRLDVRADLSPELVALEETALSGDAGRLRVDCHFPLRPAADPAAKALPATANLRAAVKDLESARALYPILNRLLGPVRAAGPLEVAADLEARPADQADAPLVWNVKVHADLTQAALSLGDGPGKPVGTPVVVDGVGTVTPGLREANLERLDVRLDKATLRWAGTGRVRWPEEPQAAPSGRFDGGVDILRVEAAGALLAPDRFPADAPPLAGAVKLRVRADLADGRLKGTLGADLTQSDVRIPQYLDKPAGPAALASLEGTWQPGDVHNLDGVLTITLPGGKLLVKGQSEIRFDKLPEATKPSPAPAPGLGEAQALRRLSVNLSPDKSLEVRAEATDLARLVALSPFLAERLKGYLVAGAAEGTLVLTVRPQAVRVSGDLDLTPASLDLAGALVKPGLVPLRIALALDLLPPEREETVRVQLDNLEARLGQSVAKVAGSAELASPTSLAGVKTIAQALAMLSEAKLSLESRLDHGPTLRKALPWLEPLYDRCAIEGATRLVAEFDGTPIRGSVHLDLDATACRFLEPGSLAKPAGTPAAVILDARYGDVPGELILDRLEMKLADAETRVSGQLLFDDPRLSTLAPPTTWSLRADGRVPDVARLAALFPARVAAFKPAGGVTFAGRASADPFGMGIEQFDLTVNNARFEWLAKPVSLDGRVSYDGNRLATEGLHFIVGRSDLTLVAYVTQPYDAPTGSVLVRGKTLAIDEVLDLLTQSHERLSPPDRASGAPPAAPAIPPAAVRRLQQLIGLAQVSGDIQLDQVTLTVPAWQTTYDLADFRAESRQSGNRFVVPRFRCTLDEGQVTGEIVLDFRPRIPVISYAFTAQDLKMADNLRPFVDRTFPGMQIFGTLSTRQTMTQPLAEGARAVGQGETVLTDGLMVGPGAPNYVTALFPGLALSEYRFNKMSNVFRNLENGDTENRMIFDGRAYDIYIFGTSRPDGRNTTRTDYTLGVDLSVSLGSKVWSRELDQGKIPLLEYSGRIVGTKYAEQDVRYVLPHQLAWDVFVRRNLVIQLIRSLGRKPPDLKRPPVGPDESLGPGAAP